MSVNDDSTLASYRQCAARIISTWPTFRAARADRLRHGNETEKVAEAIIEDLLTQVLDWSKGDLLYQVGYADIVLSNNLTKYLVIEVKRPGSIFPGRKALESAVLQARKYADEQKIQRVAASDGRYFYAADVTPGGLEDRVLIDLARTEPSPDLWYLSIHGIYRPRRRAAAVVPNITEESSPAHELPDDHLLHSTYKLPATCFAYVPDANKPKTWKLPYLLADGSIDSRRLPKAIQCLVNNYRGKRVRGIPETAIPNILLHLARAAASKGLLPPEAVNAAPTYQQLVQVLNQLGLSNQISM